MSLVRVRAALGQERPPGLMLWVGRAHLVPLVGLALSGGCSESRESQFFHWCHQRMCRDVPAAILARPLGP